MCWQLENESAFKAMLTTNGSTARELFDDRVQLPAPPTCAPTAHVHALCGRPPRARGHWQVEALQEGFDKLRHRVKDCMKDAGKV